MDLISAFLNLNNKINIIYLTFVEKLGFTIQSTNIGTQKIDSTIFETYKMVIVILLVINQVNKVKFFKRTLMTNINPDIIFVIFFLILSNINVNFSKKKL